MGSDLVRLRLVTLTLYYFTVRGERWHNWTKMKFFIVSIHEWYKVYHVTV